MRKLLCTILALIMTVSCLLILCSCGEKSPDAKKAPDETEPLAVYENECSPTVEGEAASIADSTCISAEEIARLIDLSIQIDKCLSVEAPNNDYENPVQHNDIEYYPVIDEKYDTWEEWETYIRSAYTDKLAEEHLAYDSIVNINGKTYCNGGGMGYDLTDDYTYEIISDEAERVTVHVKNPSVWNDEDTDSVFDEKDYVLVKVDGGWKIDDIVFNAALEADDDTYWSDFYEDLRTRPDGKEVTIFADNTFDCDYSGYKEIGYDFWDLHRSVMAPKDWNGFRFAPKCDYGGEQFENGLTGIPVYDGSLPVKIDSMKREHDDYTDYFANKPMEKSVFFFAEAPWQNAQDFIAENITKYDHETYIDKKGRSMQVYFLDGLPKYACYDDFFNLCVWFNLKDEGQIPIAVNMINSIEVTLSSNGMFALNTAERLGYTIIPPED